MRLFVFNYTRIVNSKIIYALAYGYILFLMKQKYCRIAYTNVVVWGSAYVVME